MKDWMSPPRDLEYFAGFVWACWGIAMLLPSVGRGKHFIEGAAFYLPGQFGLGDEWVAITISLAALSIIALRYRVLWFLLFRYVLVIIYWAVCAISTTMYWEYLSSAAIVYAVLCIFAVRGAYLLLDEKYRWNVNVTERLARWIHYKSRQGAD